MSLLGVFLKQPAETESYTISYEDDLTAGDNIVSAVVGVSPAGLTVQTTHVDDPHVRVWLTAGANGTTYKVTVTTTTADGRVLQDEFKVKVKDI